ncbi:hypothetical protein [Mycolicibacterium mageritense]|uniref:hypothetical protein n=1 Tax=Mycolicibacterium mageritense TaxID=53462 RepID=UPI001E56343B|nr:hypothetical protein [Mycolicibacterium mageritense]GJJ22320.1 hypothetical protein MTY414_59930 [Mycolicibacterium mageritense]
MSDIVFLDTETLGLDIDSPIWEFAAIRRRPAPRDETLPMFGDSQPEWVEDELHLFIQHDPDGWLDELPDEFANDYRARFDETSAFCKQAAARSIASFLGGRPHIVGAVPNFDTERLSHQLLEPRGILDPWHYHLIDVENLVAGYLAATTFAIQPPWKSDELSDAIGVDPEQFDRHTAMGDVLWVRAQWDAVMGGAR